MLDRKPRASHIARQDLDHEALPPPTLVISPLNQIINNQFVDFPQILFHRFMFCHKLYNILFKFRLEYGENKFASWHSFFHLGQFLEHELESHILSKCAFGERNEVDLIF